MLILVLLVNWLMKIKVVEFGENKILADIDDLKPLEEAKDVKHIQINLPGVAKVAPVEPENIQPEIPEKNDEKKLDVKYLI